MKHYIFALLLFSGVTAAFAQSSVECHYFVGKKKVFFELINNSLDTIELDFFCMDKERWNNPKLGLHYFLSQDTLILIMADNLRPIIQYSGEEGKIVIDGKRLHHEILPGRSFKFYMKIKPLQYIKNEIKYIYVVANKNIPVIQTTKLSKNNIKIDVKPLKLGGHL